MQIALIKLFTRWAFNVYSLFADFERNLKNRFIKKDKI